MLADLSPEIQVAWENRYPCGVNGGWLHYSVSKSEELLDLVRLVGAKVKPKKSQEKDSQNGK